MMIWDTAIGIKWRKTFKEDKKTQMSLIYVKLIKFKNVNFDK